MGVLWCGLELGNVWCGVRRRGGGTGRDSSPCQSDARSLGLDVARPRLSRSSASLMKSSIREIDSPCLQIRLFLLHRPATSIQCRCRMITVLHPHHHSDRRRCHDHRKTGEDHRESKLRVGPNLLRELLAVVTLFIVWLEQGDILIILLVV